MPVVTFDIPVRTINALAGIFRYQTDIPAGPFSPGVLIPNPENKNQFVKRMIIDRWKRETLEWEREERSKEADAAVSPEELIIT